MKRLSLVVVLAAAALWPALPTAQGTAKPPAGRVIEIVGSDAGGKYFFKPDVITAKPGEQLVVRLRSVVGAMGKMPKMAMAHNFVLIKPTVNAQTFANAAIAGGFQNNFIAANQKGDILASTALAGIGETVEVAFKAPAAGSYPFLCTFPGHFAGGMKGTMNVK
jgi:azurin